MALYIAGIMYVSIVATALLMHVGFDALGITPESSRQVGEVTRFAIDYTFWLNLAFVGLAGAMVWLHRRHRQSHHGGMSHDMPGGGPVKRAVALACAAILVVGMVASALTGGA